MHSGPKAISYGLINQDLDSAGSKLSRCPALAPAFLSLAVLVCGNLLGLFRQFEIPARQTVRGLAWSFLPAAYWCM
jgi:hypothetical protein